MIEFVVWVLLVVAGVQVTEFIADWICEFFKKTK